MLAETHKKLAIVYTAVFGLFLLAFTGIVCFILVWGTYVERTEEVKMLAAEIAQDQQAWIMQHYKKPHLVPREVPIENNYDISGQVFYYILDSKGQLFKIDSPVPVLHDAVYDEIKHWDPRQNTKISIVPLPDGETVALALTAYKVQRNNTLLATIYAGRDVTAYARSLLRSIMTLTGTACLFLFLAAVIGYVLAGKVTRPIEQSIQRKKQFIADASHELRTPLSVLLTSIEAIEMDKDNALSPFTLQIMHDAKDEFSRLKRLVNDLLTLARADTGDLTLKKEVFSLNLIVDQVIRSLKTAAEQQKIQVQPVLTGTIHLNADPERIYQLVYILVDNGLKYSPPHSSVSVYLEQLKNGPVPYVKITVEDTGPGIPPEFQEQIFQRFFRIDGSRSRDIEGSGLGLSIAHWIVMAHKGEIFVNSKPGQGSQFIVLLPDQ